MCSSDLTLSQQVKIIERNISEKTDVNTTNAIVSFNLEGEIEIGRASCRERVSSPVALIKQLRLKVLIKPNKSKLLKETQVRKRM